MPSPEPAAARFGRTGLVVEGVTAAYGARDVLHDVSLQAPPGQLTGLIGPNGSGKTTLLRVASRQLRPRRGTVRVEGIDPYGEPARKAARLVAVVPQEVAPVFAYSVLEIVLMGRAPYQSPWGGGSAQDWAEARRAMAATNVQHFADRPIQELSGGERQRVVLAQALAQDAPVLLLDEPTTHLDVRHVLEVLSLLRVMAREEGKAVLAIFHDLNTASAACDRIHVLAGGRVVAGGPPGSVLTRELMAEVFGIEAEVTVSSATGRPAVVPAPLAPVGPTLGTAPRAHVIGGAGRGAGILRALGERGFQVSAGVLHSGDTDAVLAERLNLLRVTVPPFSRIDGESFSDCLDLIRRSCVLVLCDAPFGPGNVDNLRLALEAAKAGLPVFALEQTPMAERDFTGGEATSLWEAIRARAWVAASEEELLNAIGEK